MNTHSWREYRTCGSYVSMEAGDDDDDDVIKGSNRPCSARKVCLIGPASASRERMRILRTRKAYH